MIGIPLGRELERLVTVAPFGFQLWDSISGRPVSDQLTVVGTTPGGLQRTATAGPSGTFSLRHRPSGWAFTSGAGDADFWDNPPPVAARWSMAVTDRAGRFQPFTFDVEGAIRVGRTAREVCGIGSAAIASDVTGLAAAAGSPRDDRSMPVLPLFSTPARPIPGGYVPITTQLSDPDGRAIAGALVRVTLPRSRPAFGMSDGRGVAVIPVAYPELEDAHASPPASTPRPLQRQTWPVTVEVFVDPDLERPERPDLCAVLAQLDRQPARIVGQSPPATALETTLEYGMPLVVSEPGRSELRIDAASSE